MRIIVRYHLRLSSRISPSTEFWLCKSGSDSWLSILCFQNFFWNFVFFIHYSLEPSNVSFSGITNSLQNIFKVSPTLFLLTIGYNFVKYLLLANTWAYRLLFNKCFPPSSVSVDHSPIRVLLKYILSALYPLESGSNALWRNFWVVLFKVFLAWAILIYHQSLRSLADTLECRLEDWNEYGIITSTVLISNVLSELCLKGMFLCV